MGYTVPELLPFVVTTGVGVLGGSAVPRLRSGSGDDDGVTGAPASASEVAGLDGNPHTGRPFRSPSALHRTDTGGLLHPRTTA
jgi:hypothetical protein